MLREDRETLLPWSRRDWLFLAGFPLLALLLRAVHLLTPYVVNLDAIDYVAGAKAIADGKLLAGVRATHFSAYPFLIALAHPWLGDWVAAARIWPVLFGILTTIPMYLLSREMLGRSWAWLPVLFYLLAPSILQASVDVIREPLFWFPFCFFLWVWIRATRSGSWRQFLLAGVVGLLAVSVRMDGLVLVVACSALTLLLGLLSTNRARGIGNSAALAAPTLAALGVAVFLLASQARTGDLLEWGSYRRQAQNALAAPRSLHEEVARIVAETQRPRLRHFFSVAWENRHALAAWDYLRHWVKAAHPLFFALMLLGLLATPWRREQAWLLMAALMAVRSEHPVMDTNCR